MVCSLQTERCPRQVEVLSLQTLIEMVQSVPPVDTPVVIGVCNDCLSRTIVIRHRDTHGTERIYRASWNDVTMSGVPREILQIYDAVVALRK